MCGNRNSIPDMIIVSFNKVCARQINVSKKFHQEKIFNQGLINNSGAEIGEKGRSRVPVNRMNWREAFSWNFDFYSTEERV